MSKRNIALIVVDAQEDFCPPNGSLAVPGGREIAPTINSLLALPFARKIATKDHHPPDHISFACNHGPSAKAFETYISIANPGNPSEIYESLLWPVHCVANTPGNELIPELDLSRVDKVIVKGTDPRVEMYSAFQSPLKNPPLPTAVSELAGDLRDADITDVVVVGLAGDYCVKFTALDSVSQGWPTFVVEDGTRSVGGADGWQDTRRELQEHGVHVVDLDWVKQNLFSSAYAFQPAVVHNK
ncbi:Isochorismatase hydrolase [Cytidiella melzeri]|nr:Isochorismatase hydrolase [Cytidiella melzeri]